MNAPIHIETTAAPAKPSRLWLWFVAAFLIQAAAWIAWFTIAAQHRVQEVPLVGSGKI
jgi:hypothetical protein